MTEYKDWDFYPEEMAEMIIEMCEDMDCHDYDDSRESTIADLTAILYKVKDYGESNEDFKFLYGILDNLCATFDKATLKEMLL